MASFGQRVLDKHIAKIREKVDAAAEQAKKEVGKAADEYAFETALPDLEEQMNVAYWNATSSWYRAYTPKKYNRSYGFYNSLGFKKPGDMSFGWEFKDSEMVKPSWNGGSYNVYGKVFVGGAHGGPVHGHSPSKSTPIPKLFEEFLPDVHDAIQNEIDALGQEYYSAHFGDRLNEILRNMP